MNNRYINQNSNTDRNATWRVGVYCRLSKDDELTGESASISNQELICKGWFLPPNTYDCGSFVVNRKAVVGKELKPHITANILP